MPRNFIGVIRDLATREVICVINPDDDAELERHRKSWQAIRNVELVRVPRGKYTAMMTPADLAEFLKDLRAPPRPRGPPRGKR